MLLPTWRLFALLLLLQWILLHFELSLCAGVWWPRCFAVSTSHQQFQVQGSGWRCFQKQRYFCPGTSVWICSVPKQCLHLASQHVSINENLEEVVANGCSNEKLCPYPTSFILDIRLLIALLVFHEHTSLLYKAINFCLWCLEWPGTSCNFPQHQPAPSPLGTQQNNPTGWSVVNIVAWRLVPGQYSQQGLELYTHLNRVHLLAIAIRSVRVLPPLSCSWKRHYCYITWSNNVQDRQCMCNMV